MASIRMNANGTITVRAYAGTEPGTRRQRQISTTLPVGSDEALIEAEMASLDMAAEALKGNAKAMTVGTALKVFLVESAEDGLSPTTLESYESYIRRHVDPMVGSVFFDQARPALFADMYRALRRPKGEGGAGLSQSTVARIHSMLSGAFKKLLAERIVSFNPVADLSVPKGYDEEAMPLDRADYASFAAWLDASLGSPATTSSAFDDFAFATMMWVDLHTGLRRGELSGARERDWVCRKTWAGVRVEWVLVHDKRAKGKLRYKRPKSAKSRRLVKVDETTRGVMDRYMILRAKFLGLCGKQTGPEVPLFCHADGSPFPPAEITRRFRALADELGLAPWVHLHTLRHTHASYLLESEKASLRDIMGRFGHADISTTGNLYTHMLPETDDGLAKAAEGITEGMLAGTSRIKSDSELPRCPMTNEPCALLALDANEGSQMRQGDDGR